MLTSVVLSKYTASNLVIPASANVLPRILSNASANGFSNNLAGLDFSGTVKVNPSRRSLEFGTESEPRKRRRWLGGV